MLFFGLAGFLPAGALLGLLARKLVGPEYEGYPAGAWLAGMFVLQAWFNRFKCPGCGEPFHHARRWKNEFARKCLHCGLERWADPGESSSAKAH